MSREPLTLSERVDRLEAGFVRIMKFIRWAAVVIVVFFLALGAQSYTQRSSQTNSQRSGCQRSARRIVDDLNKDFVIYTADVTDPRPFRHTEAQGIEVPDLDIASSIDVGVLAAHPVLKWPAMRERVAVTGFRCSDAYPDPGLF